MEEFVSAYFDHSGCAIASRAVLSFAMRAAITLILRLSVIRVVLTGMWLGLQTPTLSLRCEAMQRMLVQLLQQLHMIDDQRLQGLLLTECCTYLQHLLLKPGTGSCSASPTTVLHTTCCCNKARHSIACLL